MKKNIIYVSIFLVFILIINILSAQNRKAKGLILDDEAYSATPQKATLLTRDFATMPTSASLKKYCPVPGDQGTYGTCVAWSSTYAARSIIEAIRHNWTDPEVIKKEAFAPGYTYYYTKDAGDTNCTDGTRLGEALALHKSRGVPKFNVLKETCLPDEPDEKIINSAEQNKIKDYVRLFGTTEEKQVKIQSVKKALAEKHPVLIGMSVTESFSDAKEFWTPLSDDSPLYGNGHAMCVIGYDDAKEAFEIMNSWGTTWGKGGFTWVKYNDFATYVKYAYEVYPDESLKKTEMQPSETLTVDLAGSFRFVQQNGNVMSATKMANSENYLAYKLDKAVTSGLMYRMYLNNNEPAYIYVIASDLKNNTSVLFPFNAQVSAYLAYQDNNIALPDEHYFNQFDNTIGTDYICLLYSKESLDAQDIVNQCATQTGLFPERIYKVMKDRLVVNANISAEEKEVRFDAKSGRKSVVMLMLEAKHD